MPVPSPASLTAGGIDPLGTMFSRLPCVVDTHVLAFDVIQGVTRGRSTALVGAARNGNGPIFAAAHVHGEVQRLLERRAAERAIDCAKLYQVWNQRYAPLVRFVDVPPVSTDARLAAVAAIDPDDEPTARLALLLSPCFLLSKDRALVDVGLATPEWLPVVIALRLTGLIDSGTLGFARLSALLGLGGYQAARLAARHPRFLLLALTVLSAGFALRGERLAADARYLLRHGQHIGDQVMVTVIQLLAEQHRAIAAVDGPIIKPSLDTPVARVAGALARERWPVTATSLADVSGLAPATVREVLGSHPAFVQKQRRWQLGDAGPSFPVRP